jgi:hypothetical protein
VVHVHRARRTAQHVWTLVVVDGATCEDTWSLLNNQISGLDKINHKASKPITF